MEKKILCLICFCVSASQASATEVWIGRYFQNSITRFNLEAGTNLGSVDGGSVSSPLGMLRLPNGEVFATSEATNTIRRYSATGTYMGIFANAGLSAPTALATNASGEIFAANFNSSSITKYAANGTYLGEFVTAASGLVSGPDLGMTFGPDGNLYVPNYYTHHVARFNGVTGAFMGNFIPGGSGGLITPRQLLWRDGKLYVASDDGSKVLRYDGTTGAFIDEFVAAGSGTLSGAAGMAFLGNTLYVTSWRNGKLLKFDATTGASQGVALSGLGSPVSIQLVPEPATVGFLALGLAAMVRHRR